MKIVFDNGEDYELRETKTDKFVVTGKINERLSKSFESNGPYYPSAPEIHTLIYESIRINGKFYAPIIKQ